MIRYDSLYCISIGFDPIRYNKIISNQIFLKSEIESYISFHTIWYDSFLTKEVPFLYQENEASISFYIILYHSNNFLLGVMASQGAANSNSGLCLSQDVPPGEIGEHE